VQGYIFSRPVPAHQVQTLLRDNPYRNLVQREQVSSRPSEPLPAG